MILDSLSAHKGSKIRQWARKNKVELCFTPTNASWANPTEAHFGPLRQFTLANSNHPHHTVQTRALQAYLRWRNANTRHPDVPACWRPSARSVPASAARKASAGADAPSSTPHDRTGRKQDQPTGTLSLRNPISRSVTADGRSRLGR